MMVVAYSGEDLILRTKTFSLGFPGSTSDDEGVLFWV
jgi:hypothetical protein